MDVLLLPSTVEIPSLSTAIVFGLGFATVLTLIVTPAALLVIARMSERRKAWVARWRRVPAGQGA